MNFNDFVSVVEKVAKTEGITRDTKISSVLNSFEFVNVIVLLEEKLNVELSDDDLVYDADKTFGEFADQVAKEV